MKVGFKVSEHFNVEKKIRDNNRDVIDHETVTMVASQNPRTEGTVKGIVFNTVEVPVLYTDASEEEEAAVTEEAKKIAETEKISEEDKSVDEDPIPEDLI